MSRIRQFRFLGDLVGDLRFGFRLFLKHPGFSLLSVLALGLGIHLVTNQLMIINAFLYRGLPLPDAERIVDIARLDENDRMSSHPMQAEELREVAASQQSLEAMGGFYQGTVNISHGRNPVRLHGAFITWNFMDIIGVQVARGREFSQADSAADARHAVIISHRAWVRDFEADPALVGRSVRMNAEPAEIVGIAPEGLHFPFREDAWVALRQEEGMPTGEPVQLRGLGRLKEGITIEAAQKEFNTIAARLAEAAPDQWKEFRILGVDKFHRGVLREDFSMLWIMLLAVSFVLIIACANVANLLLARSTVRGRELAVRSAVGATRGRLIAQMLAESFALCLAGGAVGVLATTWSIEGLNRWLTESMVPYWVRAELDPRILGIVFLITVLCACLAGVIPALKATRIDILELLNETGRTSTNLHVGWFGRTVVALQVAAAFALLIVAGMMIRTLANMREVDLPRPPGEIFSARFGLFEGQDSAGSRRAEFLDQLVTSLAADRRVDAVAVTERQQFDPNMRYIVAGAGGTPTTGGDKENLTFVENVSPGYFETLGAEVVKGRKFVREDVEESRSVAVVNESFVAQFLPGREPLGQEVELRGKDSSKVSIVGVVPDLSMNGAGMTTTEQAGLYLPLDPERFRFFTVLFATSGNAARLEPLLRRTVRQLDPELPLYWVQTYAEAIDRSLMSLRIMTTMFAIFGVAAVLLAGIGIYGVVTFIVSQRTPEIGIRMALGAQSRNILQLFVRQGLAQLVGGLLAGTMLAIGLGGIIRHFFGAVGAGDVVLFAGVGMVISFVVLCSSLLPARRAVHLSPLEALRHE